ncbi:MAG: EAL domain-containing protein [Alphaproteobacteria bacterium]|nr:EAL domain-containing protein [Alphaproteobacteria bacterium SS10]
MSDAGPGASDDGQEPLILDAFTALTSAGDIAYFWEVSSDRLVWSPGGENLLGWTRGVNEGSGKELESRINAEDRPLRIKALHRAIAHRDTYDCEYRIRHERGYFVSVHDRGTPTVDTDGNLISLAGVLRRVDERHAYQAQLEQLASYDELTGLLNRRHVMEVLNQSLVNSLRYGLTGGYVSIGIDKLAVINEVYGYEAADQVLMQVGKRLAQIEGAGLHVARMGGDVFGIVMTRSDDGKLQAVADQALKLMRDAPIDIPEHEPFTATCSIGGVIFPDQGGSPQEVINMAESAMQEAKRAGRDAYRRYQLNEEQRAAQRYSLAMAETVKNALTKRQASLAYQPVVTTDGHEVVFYEALLRIPDGRGNWLTAGQIMPAIERLGLGRSVDRYAIDQAIRVLEAHPEVSLSINVSSLTVADRAWTRSVAVDLQDLPDVAKRLIIEITETVAIEDLVEAQRFIGSMRDLGCRVALDDFGAGYTSFGQLRALTIDLLKIDGSFIQGLSENQDNRLFVQTLLHLAAGLGVPTVAEFVETKAEEDVLASAGVDYLQGYGIGEPSMTPDFLKDSPVKRTAG